MAGRVEAHVMWNGSAREYWIEPALCPVMDDHRKAATEQDHDFAPRCKSHSDQYGTRTCPYYYAVTVHQTATNRVDVSMLQQQAWEGGKMQTRCGVLCMGQRRNRPPGV